MTAPTPHPSPAVEIAAGIQSALKNLLPGITVYADGVPDSPAGSIANPTPEELEQESVTFPCVAIVPSEALPQQYRSVLRAYPIRVEVCTWQPEDKTQQELYRIAYAVSEWLIEPTITLTLANWDSLVIEDRPDRENDGQFGKIQFIAWNLICHTRKAT